MNLKWRFLIGIIVSLLAGIVGLILRYIVSKYSQEKKKAIQIRRKELKVELSEAQKEIIEKVTIALHDLPKPSRDAYIRYLEYSQNIDGSFAEPPIIVSSSFSKEEIEHEVRNRTVFVEHRIRDIENRFPKEATLGKVASVNDAILSTNLEVSFRDFE